VCLFVCLSTIAAKQIEVLFEGKTFADPINVVAVLDGVQILQRSERQGREFDAAIDKLLWPLVHSTTISLPVEKITVYRLCPKQCSHSTP